MYKIFDKGTGFGTKSNVNEVIAQELHKPVTEKFQ